MSTGHQTDANQVPEVEAFAKHHGHDITSRYQVSDSAWKNGGGDEYKAELQRALTTHGRASSPYSSSGPWTASSGRAEDALRIFRQFSERGCTILSVKESWLNGSAEVQSLLIAFAGWMAERESARRSERIKAGLERKRAADPDFKQGRKPGATDKKRRRRSGYVKAWRTAARVGRQPSKPRTAPPRQDQTPGPRSTGRGPCCP